ncbi:MAG: DUF4445 domain-containing protein [Deltaproteobacteria bacterium]|nr:DUF4445 domain-containing protein [Deltaproteobacteria bacterium]
MRDDAKAIISFQPSGLSASVPQGTLITIAMQQAGILLPLDCGGKGTCGRCLVSVSGNTSQPSEAEKRLLGQEQLEQGWRLACQTKALGNLEVLVPETSESAESSWRIDESDVGDTQTGTPVVTAVGVDIPKPTLEDPRGDLRRTLEALSTRLGTGGVEADLATAGRITRVAREQDWDLNAYLRGTELVGVAGTHEAPLGLAVDLGSTKLAAYLIDLDSGKIVAARGRLNPQVSFGADVVTRLQRAISQPEDGRRLTELVRRALDGLASDLAASVGAGPERIAEMSLVGNTAMTHLLLGLPLEQLGAPPFVASLDQAIDVKARELGLSLAPGAYVHLPPLVGGFVGSDNVAMIMGSDLDRPGSCRLGLDIGTNTEVVVTAPDNEHPLFIASAPSGPTFEGAHLSSGMRAMAGAISQVDIDQGQAVCVTIDGGKPAGICGSGIIDAVAEMLRAGVINRRGHLDRSLPQVRTDNRSIRYVLVPAERSATGQDIVVTQADVSQVQLAKAAISAAAATLLSLAGLEPLDISEVVLAGSFGSHIDVETAKYIGLIPDVAGARYAQVGNAAGKGAQQVLNSREARLRSAKIPAMARYVELASEPLFNRLFARGLSFPDHATEPASA